MGSSSLQRRSSPNLVCDGDCNLRTRMNPKLVYGPVSRDLHSTVDALVPSLGLLSHSLPVVAHVSSKTFMCFICDLGGWCPELPKLWC